MQEGFGWSRSILSAAVAVNLMLFGLRDRTGTYTAAWIGAAALGGVAAVVSFGMQRAPRPPLAAWTPTEV